MATKTSAKSAQDIQDNIFRKMPVGKKIRLASNFFALARKLNKSVNFYGTGRIIISHRKNPKQA